MDMHEHLDTLVMIMYELKIMLGVEGDAAGLHNI